MKFFSQKVISAVAQIPEGKVLTYKEVAKCAGIPQAARAVGNILAKNKNSTLRLRSRLMVSPSAMSRSGRPNRKAEPSNIPCHRVIRSDFSVGGFRGSKRDSWEKAALLLKEGIIGVVPTDTIYGIVGSALNKNTVEKIYKLKRRAPEKPMVILISSQDELKRFGVKVTPWQKKILEKLWPGKVSIILNCPSQKFSYLYRNTNTLAFRLPAKKELLRILLITGPLSAPSANWEGYPPATTITQAKKYFGNKVFYLNGSKINGKPSTLVKLTKNKLEILRPGAKFGHWLEEAAKF